MPRHPRRLRSLTVLLSILLVAPLLTGGIGARPAAAADLEYRRILFPVRGTVHYTDTFGACRDGCTRFHEGQDLMGSKLMPLLAARAGTVSWLRSDSSGLSGNMVAIEDRDGYEYRYIHVNNDTPGTDDGANPPRWAFGPGIRVGVRVEAGQVVGYMGDSGNAEGTSPHLHFEIRRPDGSAMNPWASLRLAQGLPVDGRCGYPGNPPRHPSTEAGPGYWVVDGDGRVRPYGDAVFRGDMHRQRLNAPVISMAPTPTGGGYWLLGGDGGVFTFGDARFWGSTGDLRLNAPIISVAPTRRGRGYWLLGRDGGVFTFGDARFWGSTGDLRLNAPIVAMAPTPTGGGYWLLGRDGGVFTFGDARFYGSTGDRSIVQPMVGMVPMPTGRGYWLFARDGAVYTFGDAGYEGSLPGTGMCSPGPAVAMASTRTGAGYWILDEEARVHAFGDARRYGDPSGLGVAGLALAPLPA